MLHFTPLYKPSRGYMRHVYGRGDIGARSYCALFTGDAVVWNTQFSGLIYPVRAHLEHVALIRSDCSISRVNDLV